jgi:hypothetical protein
VLKESIRAFAIGALPLEMIEGSKPLLYRQRCKQAQITSSFALIGDTCCLRLVFFLERQLLPDTCSLPGSGFGSILGLLFQRRYILEGDAY